MGKEIESESERVNKTPESSGQVEFIKNKCVPAYLLFYPHHNNELFINLTIKVDLEERMHANYQPNNTIKCIQFIQCIERAQRLFSMFFLSQFTSKLPQIKSK